MAFQFFSLFFTCFFQFTSNGFFEIRQNDTLPGQLVAVLEYDGLTRYVWRAKGTERDLTQVISQGPLQTYHVNSWGVEVIGTVIF